MLTRMARLILYAASGAVCGFIFAGCFGFVSAHVMGAVAGGFTYAILIALGAMFGATTAYLSKRDRALSNRQDPAGLHQPPLPDETE